MGRRRLRGECARRSVERENVHFRFPPNLGHSGLVIANFFLALAYSCKKRAEMQNALYKCRVRRGRFTDSATRGAWSILPKGFKDDACE